MPIVKLVPVPGTTAIDDSGIACPTCAATARRDDRFCGSCGSTLAARPARRRHLRLAQEVPQAPQTPPRRTRREPDVAAAVALVAGMDPTPASRVLDLVGPACPACGADLIEAHEPCPTCGCPVPVVAAAGTDEPLGTLHRQRAMLRRNWAMRMAVTREGATFLLHDGRLETLPNAKIPPRADQALVGMVAPALRSPVGRILLYAAAIDREAVALPWSSRQLLDHAFAIVREQPSQARSAALDALALDRVDMLDGLGLGGSEQAWLTAVHAARQGDVDGLVRAVAALPPDRYRHKIGMLAAYAEQVAAVPGAAELLAPTLRPYAASEPMAAALLRRLAPASTDAMGRLDDLAIRAARFGLPRELVEPAVVSAPGWPDRAGVDLLGGRGRLAVAHRDPRSAAELDYIDFAAAPLAVLDDLIEATADVDAEAMALGRPDPERTYLVGRTAPAALSDAEVRELDHGDEELRRRFVATGADDQGEAMSDTAPARHVRAMACLANNRPADLDLADVLPPYRTAAEHLALVLDGSAELDDRVLGDRSTWLPLVNLLGVDVLCAVPGLAERSPRFVEWLSLVAAREHLFLADWRAGVTAAMSCLELATDEAVRDEANNLLACGLHYLGDNELALEALGTAIEGEYSVALLANIGVVAARLDPELAATHLARIVRESPTPGMRRNAALAALRMWQGDDTSIWEGEEGEDRRLPAVLREPLRSVVTEAIPLEDFRTIVSAMARFDPEWLRVPANLARSPHAGSLEARYFTARAEAGGFLPVVDVLATISDWSAAPDWLLAARDDLVHQTTEFLVEHLDDPDNVAGIIANAIVRKVRGLTARERVTLALLAVATLTYHVSEQDAEITDVVIDLFAQAERELSTVDTADQGAAPQLVELCCRRIALNLHGARARELDELIDTYNAALDVLRGAPAGSSQWHQAKRLIAEVVQSCQRTRAQLNPWLRRLDHADARGLLIDFIEHCREFEFAARSALEQHGPRWGAER